MLLKLSDSIKNVPLVGEVKSQKLENLGIYTVKDILFHIPSKYKDTSNIITISQLKQEQIGTILGKVEDIKNIYTRSRKILTRAVVSDETGSIEIVWFNQRYIINTITKDENYLFEGKLNPKQSKPQLIAPTFERYYEGVTNQKHVGRVTPQYPETAEISSKWLRARIDTIFKNIDLENELKELIPKTVLDRAEHISIAEAIYKIHNPENVDDIQKARDRLAFDEMLSLALQIESQRYQEKEKTSIPIKLDFQSLYEFIESLPYSLTHDQIHVIKDILGDIQLRNPMRRLLNGDVGSGKTVVATAVMYGIYKQGKTSVLMVPTSILARQHYKTISSLLKKFDVKIQLRTSLEKSEIEIEPQIIIGTHALLFEKELPDNIGLVIVDEQHRFGVNQRKHLLETDSNGIVPHYLSMTATPIPRTLTNILFGDMSVSFIHEMPHNRIPVKTHFVPNDKRESCYKWVREKIVESGYKEQAFIIFPLIEESKLVEAKSAKIEFEKLKSTVFKGLKVALVHGQLKEKDKDSILSEFKDGKYNVLVATPVVEVGIDIPNATMIVIENSERFGLAQLHQFRGRVGRNDMQSYCYVIAGEQVEGDPRSSTRLEYFSKHNSGFDVAQYDLESRGPGEVFGSKQSGLPQFKVAAITDINLLLKCREYAQEIITMGYNIDELIENLFK